MSSPHWLNRKPGSGRRHRLFCFPYAGGGVNSFLPWQSALGDEIDVCAVQLPGRGPRLLEPSIRSFEELIGKLSDLVTAHAELPFSLMGHSLGALMAFEVARRLHRYGLPTMRGLLVSGCEAPQSRSTRKRLHELDDEALLRALEELNGTPTDVLRDRELMQLLLPSIRADLELFANYRYLPAPPLQVPITVFAGINDNHVEHANVAGWCAQTEAGHAVHWLAGDHFFIDSQRAAVVAILHPLLSAGR